MCEKRIRKIKKGSHLTRMREARRVQRIQLLATPVEIPIPIIPTQTIPCPPQAVDKTVQNRVILELAWKTIALMHKNRIIQQKIIALQKETSEFVASVMSNPESQRRYLEQTRIYRSSQNEKLNENTPLKLESNV